MTTPSVIAIGLDAADPDLMERWMDAGHLPVLDGLRRQGGYGRLDNLGYYKAETPWTTFLTGCMPAKTGYWTPVKFIEGSYRVEEVEAYDFKEFPPFYALGPDWNVAIFDVPQTVLTPAANGPQVLAWGAHSPQTPSHSRPAELYADLVDRHGPHPALHHDHGEWWNTKYLHFLHGALLTGIDRRADICCEWFEHKRWNLFMTFFSETHSAGHDFWFLSRPDHPLYPLRSRAGFSGDPMLDVFRRVDTAIGRMLEAAPDDATVVVFSVHGSDNNVTDVPSMLFLPEFLYRLDHPGEQLVAGGRAGTPVPPMITEPRNPQWPHEIRDLFEPRHPLHRLARHLTPRRAHRRLARLFERFAPPVLLSPKELKQRGQGVAWQPTTWYSAHWPQMDAFALPSFSEGYVRINLAGREPQGRVRPEDYEATCARIESELERLVDARTGKPVVKHVVRTRDSADDRDPKRPEADLVVVWADTPTDVVDHPTLGRIGPVPYRRTGSHRPRGFWIASGAGIAPGTQFKSAHAVDLPATILALMDAPVPDYMDGRPQASPGTPDAARSA